MEPTEFHINNLFWTVQGEGSQAGRRALFIRLPYCNYDCPWCDTEYNSYQPWTKQDFIKFAEQETTRFAVITGGEPMAHKHLLPILQILKQMDFEVACETNGSLPVPAEVDFVTTSPKAYTKGKHEPYYVHPSLWDRSSEWKYVVDESFDFAVLQRHKDRKQEAIYSLSPEYNQMKTQVPRILDYIKQNPHWKLSLQTHKWINIP